MSGISITAMLDLLKGTLPDYDPKKRTELVNTRLTDYVFFNDIYKDTGKRENVSSTQIQRFMRVDTSGNARMTNPGEPINPNSRDVVKQITAYLKYADTHFSLYDVELLQNKSKEQIFNVINGKRDDSIIDMAQLAEEQFWQVPVSTDVKALWGILYWITMYGWSSGAGFVGGAASGFSDTAGVSHANYKNWCAQFTNYTYDDLITVMDTAFYNIGFKAPMGLSPTSSDMGSFRTRALYTDLTNRQGMKKMVRDQNENLGGDLNAKDGEILFNGNPVIHVPYLTNTYTSSYSTVSNMKHPIFMVDWTKYRVLVHEDMDMAEESEKVPLTPGATVSVRRLWFQTMMPNKRNQAIITRSN